MGSPFINLAYNLSKCLIKAVVEVSQVGYTNVSNGAWLGLDIPVHRFGNCSEFSHQPGEV